MTRVPTTWYNQAHLRARLVLHDVSPYDPAWCVADGHLWSLWEPIYPPVTYVASDDFEPVRARRFCLRCETAQNMET